MDKKKKWIIMVGVFLFIGICGSAFYARSLVLTHFENQKREEASALLDFYQELLTSKLLYQLNIARELSQRLGSNPEDSGYFNELAVQALKGDGVEQVALVKGQEFIRVLPTETYSGMIGQSLRDVPFAYTISTIVNDAVAEGPMDFLGNGKKVFLFAYPVLLDGEIWGEVTVCVDYLKVIERLGLDNLSQYGYEYELWQVESQNGSKNIVQVSDESIDFSNGGRVKFNLPGEWTLSLIPQDGWVTAQQKAVIDGSCLLFALFGLFIIIIFSVTLFRTRDSELLRYIDSFSLFWNRKGFELEVNRWICKHVESFVIIYFAVDNYSILSQEAGDQEQLAYLSKVRKSISSYTQNPHIIGRFGDGNFALAVKDSMDRQEAGDLAKGLSLELIWKVNCKDVKEFLNVGYQTVLYPEDGDRAEVLIEKVISGYYDRVRQESPLVSMIDKCRKLIRGEDNVVFDEYTNADMMTLSKTINQYRKQVEQLAYLDSMCHVGNRSKYLRDAGMMISYNKKRKFTLFCVDICSFGRYNELFNVETGDQILKIVSRKLRQIFREYLYRINGDVFLGILLGDMEGGEVEARLDQELHQPIEVGSLSLSLDYWCGICSYPEYGKKAEELLEYVQSALQFVKQQNIRTAITYDETLANVLREESRIHNLLEKRLSDHSLEIWYQPIMELRSRTFTHVEALLRLKDFEGNLIPTDKAIAVAEKNRMMERISNYVLKAVGDFAAGIADGLGVVRVGVNLSAQELLVNDFASRILNQLKEAGVKPEMIALEITESMLIQSFEKAREGLEQLQRSGVCIVLDDFGVGYSSLNYLSNLPVGILKIDRSFVHQITMSSKQHGMLKAIVEMSKCNELLVIAEGVETEEELLVAESTAVEFIQGYYYSPALPLDELCRLLQQNKQ